MAVVCVIPCGSEKADQALPARDLYVGSSFRLALAAAEAEIDGTDGRILVLSAKHGLIDLDTPVEPYDVRMGDTDAISADLLAAQLLIDGVLADDDDVYGFLPRRYFDTLDAAMRTVGLVPPADVYEATAGIGEQRHVCAVVRDY